MKLIITTVLEFHSSLALSLHNNATNVRIDG